MGVGCHLVERFVFPPSSSTLTLHSSYVLNFKLTFGILGINKLHVNYLQGKKGRKAAVEWSQD